MQQNNSEILSQLADDHLTCPVTLMYFWEPVALIPEGTVIEKDALEICKGIDPKTRQPYTGFVPARYMRNLVDDFISKLEGDAKQAALANQYKPEDIDTQVIIKDQPNEIEKQLLAEEPIIVEQKIEKKKEVKKPVVEEKQYDSDSSEEESKKAKVEKFLQEELRQERELNAEHEDERLDDIPYREEKKIEANSKDKLDIGKDQKSAQDSSSDSDSTEESSSSDSDWSTEESSDDDDIVCVQYIFDEKAEEAKTKEKIETIKMYIAVEALHLPTSFFGGVNITIVDQLGQKVEVTVPGHVADMWYACLYAEQGETTYTEALEIIVFALFETQKETSSTRKPEATRFYHLLGTKLGLWEYDETKVNGFSFANNLNMSFISTKNSQLPSHQTCIYTCESVSRYKDEDILDLKKITMNLFGAMGVGKTTMLNCLSQRSLSDSYGFDELACVFIQSKIHNEMHTHQFMIWDDLYGARGDSLRLAAYCKRAQVGVVIYDITSQESFETARAIFSGMKKSCEENTIFVLVGNKSDLSDQRQVSHQDVNDCIKEFDVVIHMETSATKNHNVMDLLIKIDEEFSKLNYQNNNYDLENNQDADNKSDNNSNNCIVM